MEKHATRLRSKGPQLCQKSSYKAETRHSAQLQPDSVTHLSTQPSKTYSFKTKWKKPKTPAAILDPRENRKRQSWASDGPEPSAPQNTEHEDLTPPSRGACTIHMDPNIPLRPCPPTLYKTRGHNSYTNCQTKLKILPHHAHAMTNKFCHLPHIERLPIPAASQHLQPPFEKKWKNTQLGCVPKAHNSVKNTARKPKPGTNMYHSLLQPLTSPRSHHKSTVPG
jgi:hypothetical protein